MSRFICSSCEITPFIWPKLIFFMFCHIEKLQIKPLCLSFIHNRTSILFLYKKNLLRLLCRSHSEKFKQYCKHAFHSHSPPVHLRAPLQLFQLEAGNLQDAEETVAHHAWNAVIHAQKALSKPGRQDESKRRLKTGIHSHKWKVKCLESCFFCYCCFECLQYLKCGDVCYIKTKHWPKVSVSIRRKEKINIPARDKCY